MSISKLNNIMEQLIAAHESLLALAKDKTVVLVHNQIDNLNQIVNRESKLLKQVSLLDKDRVDAIGVILTEKGYRPSPHISVSEITKLVFNAEEKQALQDLQKKLLTIIDKLREANALNQQLIEQSLSFIDYSLDLVLGGSENEAVYTKPTGPSSGMRRKGVFDSRA